MNSRTIIPFTRLQRSVLTNWLGKVALDVLKYGDGGVNVTGVPNCFGAEGATKRRVFAAFFGKLNFACWGLQFFSHFHAIKLVLRNVNRFFEKITNVIILVKQILIARFYLRNTSKLNVGDINFSLLHINRLAIHHSLRYLPYYFLQTNFTFFFSSLPFSLNSFSLSSDVNTSLYPQWLVPSDLELPQVSIANQSNENVVNSEVVLFIPTLCYWVLGNQQLKIKLFTNTWQSDCANLLKSRKDTPRNFLIHAQLTAFFLEHRHFCL